MAEGEKPYRRYRGGRVKGRVPLDKGRRAAAEPARGQEKPPRRRRWGLWIVLGIVGLLALSVVWGVLGYLSFASGIDEANQRLPRRAEARLAEHDGSLLSDPATILVIGTDGGKAPGRGDARRSDSLLLLRTDPGKHRLSYLSIPRDLRVDIPGYGSGRINAANQIGGPALTLATVRGLTGLSIHHVVVFDFDGFRELIDALGGVDVNVPKPILSNKFDCPYKPARCREWAGWRFAKGTQHLDGRRALVYARIRTNQNNAADNDLTRGSRQQAVADAVGDKIAAELFMTGEAVDANRALQIGMVNRVVPLDELMNKALEMAKRLAQSPTGSIGRIKRMLNASFSSDLQTQLDLEHRMQIESGQSSDFKEGVRAFFEKCPPNFKGN